MLTIRFNHRLAAVAALLLAALLGQALAAPAQGRATVYLPMASSGGPAPDLLVTKLELLPAGPTVGQPVLAQIIIRNIGDEDTGGAFWVDLYVDPDRRPRVNRLWPELGEQGAAWRVPGLKAGESRLLYTGATGDPDRPGEPYANFKAFSTPGEHRLYVLVDSYAVGLSAGTIAEHNEENNLLGPLTVTVSGAGPR